MRYALELALLALSASAGCAATLHLKLSYAPADDLATRVPHARACRLHIAAIVDDRPDAQSHSIGERGGAAVFAQDIAEWVSQGLDSLAGYGVTHLPAMSAASAVAAVDTDVTATMSIRRVYVHSMAVDMEAIVALEASYTHRDGRAWQRRYRGRAQKVNWFATSGEYEDILNRALGDVMRQISGDLRAACRAPAPSASARLRGGAQRNTKLRSVARQALHL